MMTKHRKADEYGALVLDFIDRLYAEDVPAVWDYLSSENRAYMLGIACGMLSQTAPGKVIPSSGELRMRLDDKEESMDLAGL